MPSSSDQPSPATDTDKPEIAGLTRRLLAIAYDTFLLAACLFCTFALYTIIVVSLTGDFSDRSADIDTGDVITELEPVDLGWPIYPILAAVYLSFFVYFWRATGQTLGMQVWKIKLVADDGATITIEQCLIRIGVAFLSFGLLGFGYIALLFNKKRGTWHDRISGSQVIRTIAT